MAYGRSYIYRSNSVRPAPGRPLSNDELVLVSLPPRTTGPEHLPQIPAPRGRTPGPVLHIMSVFYACSGAESVWLGLFGKPYRLGPASFTRPLLPAAQAFDRRLTGRDQAPAQGSCR